MTVMAFDALRQRDARIAELEAKGRSGRTPAERDELARLQAARDLHWQRLPAALAAARRYAREIEAYAHEIRFPIEEMQA